MRTVVSTDSITIKVTKDELIKDKWLSFQLLSKKLCDIENANNMEYKKLRNKMYNSQACGKYNAEVVAGMRCINTANPMKGKASLEIKFEVE